MVSNNPNNYLTLTVFKGWPLSAECAQEVEQVSRSLTKIYDFGLCLLENNRNAVTHSPNCKIKEEKKEVIRENALAIYII
ncbi:hypothetical protein BB560_004432, partial [Smittium megazygosporum]